jgi:16S rRNA (guanine(966)-N(2))-methyltransferase RsmD
MCIVTYGNSCFNSFGIGICELSSPFLPLLVHQVGDLTRPMMEKVRGAVFNALISRLGGHALPSDTRWLDLFAGTGSVGIEGLSRGACDAHFIELDPWVVTNVLEPNLELTSVAAKAAVHQMRAEDFLKKAAATPRFAGGAFDFVSVCPPYLLVSYPELFSLLEESPLLHAGSHVIVEYPKELSHEIPDVLAGLHKFRDRRYGRTFLAMYGPE